MKRYAFFDFDGTLSDSPLPEVGKPLWEEKTGKQYPHKGWWSKKESLDPVLDVQPHPEMIRQLEMLYSTGWSCWILTNRMIDLKPQIEALIAKWGMIRYFEGFSYCGKFGQHKGARVKRIIEERGVAEEVVFFDDDTKNLVSVHEACLEMGMLKGQLKMIDARLLISK